MGFRVKPVLLHMILSWIWWHLEAEQEYFGCTYKFTEIVCLQKPAPLSPGIFRLEEVEEKEENRGGTV